jgi:glutamate/tyrosine decarboxylase-like PLP-dependent enzyme
MLDRLNLPPSEFGALARQAVDFVTDYYESLSSRPAFVPTTAKALRDSLDEPLPQSGVSLDAMLAVLDGVVSHYNRHSAHSRLFGYICSPGAPITSISHLIAAALNMNVTAWRSAPSGAQIEHTVIRWIKEMTGYPSDAAGVLVSGGSMANFAGLAAARSAKAPFDVVTNGLAGAPRMCIYVSAEGHFSVAKAAAMLGLGEANVRPIETDEALRIDLAALERRVTEDRAAGHLPICVVANAGTTGAGAFDPIASLAAFARCERLWLHVDAAYGGFAALAPNARHLFTGIAEADSVALDPHKWLYGPMGCGCVLYKDPATALAAFRHEADLVRRIGLTRDEAFAFWDYGPELSRPARALDLWMLIKFVGAAHLAEAVEQNMACARYFAQQVEASGDFEMLAPVGLSVFCFRHRPSGFTGDLNAHNERLLIALQRGGSSYLSNTTIRGQFALRGCVLNYRATEHDMDRLLGDLRSAASAIAAP